jgi:hypothetical protein
MGVSVSLPAVIWASSAAVVTYVLPVSGIGGFGSHEAGWTAGFRMVGVSTATALATGFAVNVLCTAAAVLLGILAWLLGARAPRAAGAAVRARTASRELPPP